MAGELYVEDIIVNFEDDTEDIDVTLSEETEDCVIKMYPEGDYGEITERVEAIEQTLLTKADSTDVEALEEELNADVTQLKEDLTQVIDSAYVTDTASGAIASFPDGANNMPVKSLIVDVEPVQDLHGYDSPWPAGGGKNLFYHEGDTTASNNGVTATFNNNTQSITISGTNTSASAYILLTLPITSDVPRNTPLCRALINVPSGVYINFTYKKNRKWVGVNNGEVVPEDTDADASINIQVGVLGTATTISQTVMYVELEKGSTAPTAYAPYSNICPITGRDSVTIYHSGADMANPTIHTIQLGQTIYGGTLDVTQGVLTVDRAMVDLGTLDWEYNTTYAFFITISLTDRKIGVTNMVSDLFKTQAGSWSGTPRTNAIWGNGSNATIYVQYPITEVSEFLSLISGHQLCYELATPITIQLTAQQMTTLLGQNNVWSDAGDTEVEYRADTKLYIEKLTAPTEDDMVADHAISANSFFMVGNTLYRATTAIASRATITVGTNATKLSLSDALNALA